MDPEEQSDFQALRNRFQGVGHSSTLPAYTKAREQELPPPNISRIRLNKDLQGIINTLEHQVRPPAPPIAKKPELPAKPNGLQNDMKLGKVFRQTFHIKDSKTTDDDGVCGKSPQMYRHSLPVLQKPPPDFNQPAAQEVYEDVDSAWPKPQPSNDLKREGSKHKPPPIGPKPVKMTGSPTLDVGKEKNKEKVDKVPSLKTLPPITSLGPPPSKPPRPQNVDIRTFCSFQKNATDNQPEESTEDEYEQPTLSPGVIEGDVYDEAFSPKGSAESDSNVYEDGDNSGVEYDLPEVVNPTPDASSPNETDEMSCYQDILNLRESQYSDNLYDTDEINPISSPETGEGSTYEVSDDNNDLGYFSTMSSYQDIKAPVSEGYYSVEMNTSAESFKCQENKSKEVKLGKNEKAFRKKFKISGEEKMIYTSLIMEEFKSENYSLPVKKGDTVEVIRITDCPAGKWLARNAHGNYGFVPVVSLQVNSEIQSFSNQRLTVPGPEQELYADIEVRPKSSGGNADTLKSPDSYSVQSDDHYDDICSVSQTLNSSGGKGKGFGHLFRKDKAKKEDIGSPNRSPVTTMNRTSQDSDEYHTYDLGDEHEREKEEKSAGWRSLFHRNKDQKVTERKFFQPASGVKKFSKEEKIFREKFKYTGEIKILNIAVINDRAPLSPKDKLELCVKQGETVEVLDVMTEDQIVCRNFAGKYGYVPIECLNFSTENDN